MADGAEIKSRINSVRDTKKVTDAMYMISSVKLRRARRELEKTAPYFRSLKEEISQLVSHIPETKNRYFRVPDPALGDHRRHGILLVTSDKGLVGSYNRTATEVCEEFISHHPDTVLFIIGEYGRQYFRSKGVSVVSDFRYSSELPTVWKARRICADLLEYYDDGRLDDVGIIYTDARGGVSGECRKITLLPLSRSDFAGETDDGDETEFFPDPDTVLTGVIPSYLTGFIYSSLVDSYCSEQTSRMSAMEHASDNASEMLDELKLNYNRVRQAAITREMTEIASGAAALRKKKEARRITEGTDGKR
ncbi:MAG: ATP synthase F1 subunit gamma [Clostridia bacterium]|nr:ATP synthase F1 subunit gamma [Clostridia bacterium]